METTPTRLDIPAYPDSPGYHAYSVEIEDTPVWRSALEAVSIPRCEEWRAANPENDAPAPYCCSAYCVRCNGLRTLDGVEPITPNMWLRPTLEKTDD